MEQSPKRRKLSRSSDDAAPVESVSSTVPNLEKDNRRSLFVRSLPASITTQKLIEHFSQSYPLKHATVVLDPRTKISRGFGFVTFTDSDDAQAAADEFNDSILDGRKIKVEVAEARHREIAEDLGGKAQSVNVKGQDLRAQRQKQNQDNQPPKLIVRNLPWSVKTADDLTKLFLSYGKVKHAVVPTLSGKKNAQSGFGIVILRGRKNAEKALQGVNGKVVDGRTLAVDWAVDRETWEKVQRGDVMEDGESTELQTETPLESMKNLAPIDDEDGDSVADDTNLHDGVKLLEDGNEFSDVETPVEEEEEESEEDARMAETTDEEPPYAHSTTSNKFNTDVTTVFLRNIPYSTDDDALYDHFKTNFGPVRYARVVYDQDTERPRGTAFVCFRNEADAKMCVQNAPKHTSPQSENQSKDKKRKGETLKHSILQNEEEDPSGKYTLEGRVLQVTRALSKSEADRRADDNSKEREKRATDKRRLFLLSEGTIAKGSKLYNALGKAELDIRESSAKQRQKLVKNNPNLGLSLTRLSIRNLPRVVDGKELKQLARQAIVEFAKDIKEGKRTPLSKEELARDGETEREAERQRRLKGKGVVKQAKIVYESEMTGSKVSEGKGGRSRGYGFIEYYGHRNALMGLRWLNGHLVKGQGGDSQERGKRLIVEFAIENAQVVQRRNDRDKRSRDRRGEEEISKKRKRTDEKSSVEPKAKFRKQAGVAKNEKGSSKAILDQDEKNKLAARNRIIAQKRQKRKIRKG